MLILLVCGNTAVKKVELVWLELTTLYFYSFCPEPRNTFSYTGSGLQTH